MVFLKIFIYLATSGLSYGMRDLHCSMKDFSLRRTGSSLRRAGFSLVLACVGSRGRTGSVVTACRLSSCGARAPEHVGSGVAVRGAL